MAFVLVLVVFTLVFLALILSLRALGSTGVPVKAASAEAIAAALDLLALRDGERFYDLGCGAGSVLLAARRRADVVATGVELNPPVAAFTWARCLLDRRIHVRLRDFRKIPLDQVDAAYTYMMPRALARLAPLFEQKLRPGTRLISIDFPIPDWIELDKREVGPLRQPVRLYVIGKHRA